MSRGGSISLFPGALDRGARSAGHLADQLDHALGPLTGISLEGLPPTSRGRAGQAIAHARKMAREAEAEARGQGDELRLRAALARAADEGGSALDFAVKVWAATGNGRSLLTAMKKLSADLGARERDILFYKIVRQIDPSVDLELLIKYKTPAMGAGGRPAGWWSRMTRGLRLRSPLGGLTGTESAWKRLTKLEKFLTHATPWSRPLLPLERLPSKGLLKLAKPLARKAPLVGDVATYVAYVKGGMSKTEAALRTAKNAAVSITVMASAAGTCALIGAGTAGIGLAACPAILGVGAAVATNWATDELIRREQNRRARQRERERIRRKWPSGKCTPTPVKASPLR